MSMTENENTPRAEQVHTCSICGEKYRGWGNNPAPICVGLEWKQPGRCCVECNSEVVVPTRIMVMRRQGLLR